MVNLMNKNSGIAIVIGTKAELIKCMPIMRELNKRNLDYWFIHTGQHPLSEMCKYFGVKEPDVILTKEPDIETKLKSKVDKNSIKWSWDIIWKIRKAVRTIKPEFVINHSDTISTVAASIGSSKILNPGKKWKSVHLEAGLRSGSFFEPFPEEISRRIAEICSDVFFAVSKKRYNFLKKRHPEKIVVHTGNSMIDATLEMIKEAKKMKFKKERGEYAIVNMHRYENLRSRERMKKIVNILKRLKIKTIWTLHHNTEKSLKRFGLFGEIKKNLNIKMMPLLPYYQEFLFKLSTAKFVITDGGGIQEECLVFKRPCIILRKRTEREEGLDTGLQFLSKLDVKKTIEVIRKMERGKINIKDYKNPYGEAGVSKKMVDFFEEFYKNQETSKKFLKINQH